MKKVILALATLGVMLMVSVTAMAQDAAAPAQGAGGGGQTTTYNFDDDIVQGDLVRPDGEMALARRRGRQSSLIRVREHFVPEMLKSVENL
jgi:hypothetical protein